MHGIMKTGRINFSYVIFISSISALGGLLFGYDWVVIGGAQPHYEAYFIAHSPLWAAAKAGTAGVRFEWLQGFAMSSALWGTLIGAMVSGWIADRFGRKKPLVLAALFFTLSAIWVGAIDRTWWFGGTSPVFNGFSGFMTARIIGGIGIGLASMLSPLFIAEVSPSAYRGRLVSLNQLTIVIGILAAQMTNWWIGRFHTPADPALVESARAEWAASMAGHGWRTMFQAGAVPASLFLAMTFFLPESPRWLTKSEKPEKALSILRRIGSGSFAGNEMAEIQASLVNETRKVNLRHLFEKGMPRILLIGIVLAVLQQWCGINVIYNYATDIFSAAGIDRTNVLFTILLTGVVNMAFTFVGMALVDKLGRKTLMLIGTGGLTVIYALMGAAFLFIRKDPANLQALSLPSLILVLAAIAVYATTLAPVTWVLLSEIFPNRIRATAMSIGTFSLWVACTVLTMTFPMLNSTLEASGTFWLYGGICILGFLFIRSMLVETKGKSLEQLERELIRSK
jgi:sugar porter (SP) family MFS transporter